MAREIWVQSQVESYQRFKKWYLMLSCLTLSNIRYVSRVRGSNPGKEVVLSLTLRCSSYWKGSLRVALYYSLQLYLFSINLRGWLTPMPMNYMNFDWHYLCFFMFIRLSVNFYEFLFTLFMLISSMVRETGVQSQVCNIMAEGFRFVPLGLVRLRNLRLSAWVT